MKIETKFDIGQVVWFVHDNIIHKSTIQSIRMIVFNGYQIESYGIAFGSTTIEKDSRNIFASKELLIESIDD